MFQSAAIDKIIVALLSAIPVIAVWTNEPNIMADLPYRVSGDRGVYVGGHTQGAWPIDNFPSGAIKLMLIGQVVVVEIQDSARVNFETFAVHVPTTSVAISTARWIYPVSGKYRI